MLRLSRAPMIVHEVKKSSTHKKREPVATLRPAMSAIGTKRTSLVAPHMSALGGKADITSRALLCRSAPLDLSVRK